MTGKTRHPAAEHPLRATILGAVVLCLLSVASPPARVRACDPDLPRVVARLPAQVEFVVALDDGAGLRRDLDVDPIAGWVMSRPPVKGVSEAWAALADDIGMDDVAAFDQLLGRRVIYMATGLRPGGDPRWALLSELDQESDRRLRERLEARPRGIVEGQPVLELENGAFLMATSPGALRCVAADVPPAVHARTVLLLAPSEDRDLFAALLPLLRCQAAPAPLSATPAGSALERLEGEQGVFLWRLPAGNDGADRFVTGSLGRTRGCWGVRMLAGDARSWVPSLRATPAPWSPSILQSLPGDPVLAMAGQRDIVSDAIALVSVLQPAAMVEADDAGIDDLLGDLSMVAIWDDRESTSGTPEVLIASEARDLNALEPRADAMINQTYRRQADPGLAELESADPSRVRTIDLQTLAPGAPARPATKMHWTYVRKDRPSLGSEGWWVRHYDPDDGLAAGAPEARTRAPLAAQDDLRARSYLHVGRARPGELLRMLGVAMGGAPAIAGDPGASRTMAQLSEGLRSIHWSVWVEGGGGLLEARLLLEPVTPLQR